MRDFYFACAVMMRMRPRPLCGREGVIAFGFFGTKGVSKGERSPLEVLVVAQRVDRIELRRLVRRHTASTAGRTACGVGCVRSARRPSSGRRAASGITYSLLEKIHKTAN